MLQGGDYNTEVPGQHDLKDGKTSTVCEPNDFHTASPILCAACSTNQVLYVRQLATFKSLNEDSYDEELKSYKEYLEEVYKLCPTCVSRVKEHVTEQDQVLQSKMSLAQQERLKDVSSSQGNTSDEHNNSKVRQMRLPSVPTMMFLCCLLLAIANVVICLRLFAVTVISGTWTPIEQRAAWFSAYMLWVVSVVPVQAVLSMQDLYPEDCVHLLLRLLTLVTWMEWVHVREGPTLILSILTAMFALIACLRPRKPRHFSEILLTRRDIKSLVPFTKASEAPVISPTKSSVAVVEGHEDNSSASSGVKSPPPFEEVCQNLETFSIGLTKKSSSQSSIWSLPAVVSSSLMPDNSPSATGLRLSSDQMSPDSTTGDQVPPLRPGTPRSVLSPSRLGFLNLDSNSGSRSPSPWDPIMENSSDSEVTPQEDSMPSLPRSGRLSQDMFINEQVISKDRQRGVVQNTGNTADLTVEWIRSRQVCHPPQPSAEHLHPSQSYQSTHYRPRDGQLGSFLEEPRKNSRQSPRLFSHSQNFGSVWEHNGGYSHKNNSPHTDPKNSSNPPHEQTQGVRRRSQRLAMAGRLPKPWPLRKSLSCNNATDKENVEKAGVSARIERLQQPSYPSSSTAKDFVYDPLSKQSIVPQQSQPAAMLQTAQIRNEQFFDYRDNSGGAKPTQALQPNRCSNFKTNPAPQNWYKRNTSVNMNKNIVRSEFSDDEDMEVEEPWTSSGNKQNKPIRDGDTSPRGILLGVVIGASITCNVFLLLLAWLQR
ncbi:transmembrane protein 201-like [Elysia marginata]|uniref:Transmembrane protein 201-like n=1 Tax=Elysia marginata TaxID=1093978 RepID=A0AAV4F8U2_9GAST|nr:transmembrane protein 201-like [Elysia marginata]